MALYAIGDTHLSLGADKPMDVFGGGWEGYVDKLREGFAPVADTDSVVLCGDLSWGMSLEEARDDFAFLNSELPGEKWLIKGNHDYWWNTAAKMDRFFQSNGFTRLHILHNDCALYGSELIRLETSLKAAGDREKLCFLHYPPLYRGYRCQEIIDLLGQYRVTACYYGHLHGPSHRLAIEGEQDGVGYHLVSADFVGFCPKKILE